MRIKGKAWKFGDNISTDLIAPGRYFHLRSNLPEFTKHVLEDADPEFAKNVQPGDIVVGGVNFGTGSSREHAPTIIKMAGTGVVLAKSFARIFFRNAINIGLPLVICDTSDIEAKDELEVDLANGVVYNLTKNKTINAKPLPDFMVSVLSDGGLIPHVKKNDGFAL